MLPSSRIVSNDQLYEKLGERERIVGGKVELAMRRPGSLGLWRARDGEQRTPTAAADDALWCRVSPQREPILPVADSEADELRERYEHIRKELFVNGWSLPGEEDDSDEGAQHVASRRPRQPEPASAAGEPATPTPLTWMASLRSGAGPSNASTGDLPSPPRSSFPPHNRQRNMPSRAAASLAAPPFAAMPHAIAAGWHQCAGARAAVASPSASPPHFDAAFVAPPTAASPTAATTPASALSSSPIASAPTPTAAGAPQPASALHPRHLDRAHGFCSPLHDLASARASPTPPLDGDLPPWPLLGRARAQRESVGDCWSDWDEAPATVSRCDEAEWASGAWGGAPKAHERARDALLEMTDLHSADLESARRLAARAAWARDLAKSSVSGSPSQIAAGRIPPTTDSDDEDDGVDALLSARADVSWGPLGGSQPRNHSVARDIPLLGSTDAAPAWLALHEPLADGGGVDTRSGLDARARFSHVLDRFEAFSRARSAASGRGAATSGASAVGSSHDCRKRSPASGSGLPAPASSRSPPRRPWAPGARGRYELAESPSAARLRGAPTGSARGHHHHHHPHAAYGNWERMRAASSAR